MTDIGPDTDPRKVDAAVDAALTAFTARLSPEAGLSDGDRALAYEAALKRLMGHLIDQEGWLAEEFSRLARSLGAY